MPLAANKTEVGRKNNYRISIKLYQIRLIILIEIFNSIHIIITFDSSIIL